MLRRMMASALAMTGVAYAQTAPTTESATTAAPTTSSSDRTSYDAAFFAQYNPQTALDMVNQTPGFSLNGGDDRRGFSGAVGNLLIDGVRPTSKSQSLSGILSRIPANQVVRIEVLRGAAVSGDASGQSTLVNIVRTPNAGSGVWTAGVEWMDEQDVAPRGDASYSGRTGQVEWGLGASLYSQHRSLPGWRRIYDQSGNLTAFADTPSNPRDLWEENLNGNLAFPLLGGRVSTTAQVHHYEFDVLNQFLYDDPLGADIENDNSVFGEQQNDFEVGVNYDRDIGEWTLALVGLLNRRRYESHENFFLDNIPDAFTLRQIQDLRSDTGETIGRFSLARPLGDRHRIEFGAEAALNTLEQRLELTRDENGGGPTPFIIPNSNSRIEENRAEFFVNETWRPAERWSVESRLAYETSTLNFSGDTENEVELAFWKPSIQVSRTVGENNQLRFRVYRDVGQLNFGDFVSAAAIADSLINGGNPALVPQTDWRAELGADLRFGQAALSLTLTRHFYQDVADLVPLTAPNPDEDPLDPNDDLLRFDGPGNIGDADATSLDVTFSTPLDWFLPGGRININGYLWDTEVTDPLTGRHRIISNRPESNINVEFRQDIPSWQIAWGFNASKQGEAQAYRFNEIDTSEEGPYIDMFVETTALPNDTKLRFWLVNAFDGTVNRDRRFYNSPDRTGPNTSRDWRERAFEHAPWFIIEMTGTF